MKVVEITAMDGETVYKVSPLKVGQMRQLTEFRTKNPETSFMLDNIKCVAFCLNNAAAQEAHTNGDVVYWTPEQVEELPWADYKRLLDETQKMNGFETVIPGEALATASRSVN